MDASTIVYPRSWKEHKGKIGNRRTRFVVSSGGRRFRVARLVQLDLYITRHLEVGNEAVALIGNLICENHTARLQLCDGLLDVVAVKRNVVSAGGCAVVLVGRVAAHIGLGEVEDQPTPTHVRVRKTKLVAQEGTQRLRLRRIEHGVDAFYHAGSPGSARRDYPFATGFQRPTIVPSGSFNQANRPMPGTS